MPANRLETLQTMVAQNPNDSFSRYGLAMEYANSGQHQRAVEEFRELLAGNPRYAAAYYHAGQALEKLGRIGEAKEIYRKGIEVTTQSGDLHTRGEIEAVLELLG